MKATEIQIGDWVKYTNPPYIKVASITKRKIGYHIKDDEPRMHYVRLCEVEPIPLTAEILKKNGFEESERFRSTTFRLFVKDCFVVIDSFHDNKVGRYNWAIGVHSCYTGYQCAMIHYVHELQHALRLYGIDKEIEL